MKLHLPLSLRSALLAVLVMFPLAHAGAPAATTEEEDILLTAATLEEVSPYADFAIVITGPDFETVQTNDSYTFGAGTFMDLDIQIAGQAQVSLTNSGTRLNGNTNITVSSGGKFDMSYGYIASSSGSEATINVDGGSFNMSGGEIAYYDGSSATINVDGGSFDMRGGGIASSGTATINVNDGTFNMRGGYYAPLIASSSDSVATINVNGGGTFVMSYDALNKSTIIAEYGSATINVNDGSFVMGGGCYIAYYSGSSATIKVDSGTFDMSGGYIAYSSGSEATINVNGGSFNMRGGSIASSGAATINVNGGSFDMSGAYSHIAFSGTATINVNSGGTFNMSIGYIAYSGCATINVNGGMFDMSGGCYIALQGTATINVNNGGTFDMIGGRITYDSGSTATINVNGGTFDMSGGDIAYYGTVTINVGSDSSDTNEGDASSSISVDLDDMTGGTFDMSSGSIATSGTTTINVNDGGVFTYKGGIFGAGAEFVMKGTGVFDMSGMECAVPTITMQGGRLANASQLQSNIIIETEKGFRGDLSLGGADAALVSQLQAGSGVTLSGLNGTLTIHDGDYMYAGSESVSIEDSGIKASSAMITFDDAASSGIDFSQGSLTLGFDAGTVLAARGESGEVELKIWFTNAALGDEAYKDFTIGGGWDLWFDGVEGFEDNEEGWLVVKGNISTVWFASEHTEDAEISSGVLPDGDQHTKVVINRDTNLHLDDADDGSVTLNHLEGDHKLAIDGNGEVNLSNEKGDTIYTGDITAEEGVTLKKTGDGDFTMQGKLTADKVSVEDEGAFIIGSGSKSSIASLTGDVTVKGALALGTSAEDSTIAVEKGGALTLTGSESALTTHGFISMVSGAALNLTAGSSEADAQAGANVSVSGGIAFLKGTTTTMTFNLDSTALWSDGKAMMLTTDGNIIIERNATFVLDSLGTVLPSEAGDIEGVTVMSGSSVMVVDKFSEEMLAISLLADDPDADGEQLKVQSKGLFNVYYKDATLTATDTAVILNATRRDTSLFEDITKDSGSNPAHAGSELLKGVDQETVQEDETLRDVVGAIGDLEAEGNRGRASRVIAALAGSTAMSLGAAQRDSLRGEMSRVRQHAGQHSGRAPRPAGNDTQYRIVTTAKGAAHEDITPRAADTWLHAWVEGTAEHLKRDRRGDESGYSLMSWGGSVGADMSLSQSVSVGLALSAMYGDLKANAADTARGDLDSYYLSAYAQYKPSKWAHNFILTGSRSEAKLHRQVDYVRGIYSGRGSTDGYGIGAAYELTCDIALDESDSSILQPLAGVSLVHTTMGGYSESGAHGAGLNISKQTQTTMMLTLGARWLTQIESEDLLGRSIAAELRANIAEDLGDVRSKADVALQANPANMQRVNGARAGRTALQLGAGLSLPVTTQTHAYLNANAELRSCANGWNMTAGIRTAF